MKLTLQRKKKKETKGEEEEKFIPFPDLAAAASNAHSIFFGDIGELATSSSFVDLRTNSRSVLLPLFHAPPSSGKPDLRQTSCSGESHLLCLWQQQQLCLFSRQINSIKKLWIMCSPAS